MFSYRHKTQVLTLPLLNVCAKYLHFGLCGPRHSERERVSGTVRLGEKVWVELVLVLVFEDLEKTKQMNESQIFDLPVSHVIQRPCVS